MLSDKLFIVRMTKEEMKKRTKTFALRIIKAVQALPKDVVADVIGRQMLRSGTSVGANYRAACRAKSTSDFVNKLKIVEEEWRNLGNKIRLLILTDFIPFPTVVITQRI